MSAGVDSCEKVQRDAIVCDLANDFSKYTRVNVSAEKKALEDEIEDTLTRLDEFCSLVDMVRSDDLLCLSNTLPAIYSKSRELENIFRKIDKLESVINIMKQNLDVMEEKVAEAENQLNASSVKRLFSTLQKPLFSKKTDDNKKILKYDPPEIFRADDFFKNSNSSANTLQATENEVSVSETNENLSILTVIDSPS